MDKLLVWRGIDEWRAEVSQVRRRGDGLRRPARRWASRRCRTGVDYSLDDGYAAG